MFIKISLGNSLVKKGIAQGSSHTFRNETFEPSFWLDEEQQEALLDIIENDNWDWPTPILGFEIVRGAFHGEFTRIRPLVADGNWGKFWEDRYNTLLRAIAKAIGWHHVGIDGANAVIKQTITEECASDTWSRWKKHNKSWRLRELSKANWNEYHGFIGDLHEVGEWDESKFVPVDWRK